MFGSAAGTAPGVPLPGGDVLPLVPDSFLNVVVAHLNGPIFLDFFGTLDAAGLAKARLDTLGPVPAALAGLDLHFAFLVLDPPTFASNAVTITFVP